MIYSNKKGDRKEKGYRKAEKRGVLRGKMKQSRNNMGGGREKLVINGGNYLKQISSVR